MFFAKNEFQQIKWQTPGGGGGVLLEKLGRGDSVFGPLPKTLTLFMTKICNSPYSIYDLTCYPL